MNAFVIDEEQIKKAVIILVVAVVVAFASGYLLGSKYLSVAENHNQAEQQKEGFDQVKESQSAAANIGKGLKPEESKVSKNNNSKSKSSKNKNGKDKLAKIKTGKTKNLSSKNKDNPKKTQITTKVVKPEAVSKKTVNIKKTVNGKKTDKSKNTITNQAQKNVKKSSEDKTKLGVSKKNTDVVGKAASKSTVVTNGEAVLEKKVYSIQAGMFSSEKNAKSFIVKLSVKQFDAYLSDFVSSSGAIKYNVRVGRFAQRDQARQLLKEFQKTFSSPAYVVITQ